jgi:hypothetical protein
MHHGVRGSCASASCDLVTLSSVMWEVVTSRGHMKSLGCNTRNNAIWMSMNAIDPRYILFMPDCSCVGDNDTTRSRIMSSNFSSSLFLLRTYTVVFVADSISDAEGMIQ